MEQRVLPLGDVHMTPHVADGHGKDRLCSRPFWIRSSRPGPSSPAATGDLKGRSYSLRRVLTEQQASQVCCFLGLTGGITTGPHAGGISGRLLRNEEVR